MLGYLHEDHDAVFLLPGQVLKLAREFAFKQGRPFVAGRAAVLRRIEERGLLRRRDKDHYAVKVRLDGLPNSGTRLMDMRFPPEWEQIADARRRLSSKPLPATGQAQAPDLAGI